jgi:hypothetical protein
MLDAQVCQRAPDLGRLTAIHLAANFNCVKVMTSAIGIKAQRQAMPAEHLRQRPERRVRAFFLNQERRINLACGIVHRHHQIERRNHGQPRVPRGVLVQHHSGQWTTRPPAAVRPATLRLRQQIPALQENPRPAVAPGEPVVAYQMFVEMPRGEALIARPIQTRDLLAPVHRNPFARHLADPAVQQAGLTFVLATPAPAAEGSLADTQQLGGLQLVQLRHVPAAKYAHELPHTNTLAGFRPAHPEPPKRPDLPDRSCAT